MISDFGQECHNEKGLLPKLHGPFYCRMSQVMNMPQFDIILFSPTSSSIHKEVATRFGGESGMLIEFDNSKGNGTYVSGFDGSWVSRYGAQEDERYLIHTNTTLCMYYTDCLWECMVIQVQ